MVTSLVEILMRLIQQRPAWTLHAYLRFNSADYISEYSGSFHVAGISLPVVIHEHSVLNEILVIDAVSEWTSDETGFVHALKSDSLLAQYLKNSVLPIFRQIVSMNGELNNDFFYSLPLGINMLSNVLVQKERTARLGSSEQQLLEQLYDQYKMLDSLIHDRESIPLASILSISNEFMLEATLGLSKEENSMRGLSDAILFGHLAEALCNEHIGSILPKEFPSLIKFFQDIADEYFREAPSRKQIWKAATHNLSQNPFLQHKRCEFVRKAIMREDDAASLSTAVRDDDSEEEDADDFSGGRSGAVDKFKARSMRVNFFRKNMANQVFVSGDSEFVELRYESTIFPSITRISSYFGDLVARILSKADDAAAQQASRPTPASADHTADADFRESRRRPVSYNIVPRELNNNVVTFTLGGVLYAGVVASCFVGYFIEASKFSAVA